MIHDTKDLLLNTVYGTYRQYQDKTRKWANLNLKKNPSIRKFVALSHLFSTSGCSCYIYPGISGKEKS